MSLQVDIERVVAAHEKVRSELLGERTVGGHWVGEPASSPLATATAISALVLAHSGSGIGPTRDHPNSPKRWSVPDVLQSDLSELLVESLHWLAQRQNEDGGWSDTEGGRSSVAATMLVRAAFRLTGVPAKYEGLTEQAERFITAQGGIASLRSRYGKDKSLTAPILANSALAGLVPWRQVPALPFELACLPRHWYPRLRLPVVSYAIPVLVAIGQLKFYHDPPRGPLRRIVRLTTRNRSLAVLEHMQPESGGYLESTPLTAFVVMSLASMGLADHTIVRRGVEFLLASARSDASWPIVTNLATWNTALAMNALAEAPAMQLAPDRSVVHTRVGTSSEAWRETLRVLDEEGDDAVADRPRSQRDSQRIDAVATESDTLDENCIDWLLDGQSTTEHPYTGSRPGGWAWTDLAGGVPATDDTAGALLALARWRDRCPRLKRHRLDLAARRGIEWLLDMQNADGGWPTFCRAWRTLPYDRSGCDLTVHALRALAAWQQIGSEPLNSVRPRDDAKQVEPWLRTTSAIDQGMEFLENVQRNDGSFVPLWFGNQHHQDGHNLVYGTSRVVTLCAEIGRLETDMAQRAARWLLGVQHANGGWGPPRSCPATSLSNIYRSNTSRAEDALASFCSIEETALAVEALLPLAESNQLVARSVQNGLRWLVDAVEQGRLRQPAPIGFYFAKLWYHERLYPLVFATGALHRVVQQLAPERAIAAHVS